MKGGQEHRSKARKGPGFKQADRCVPGVADHLNMTVNTVQPETQQVFKVRSLQSNVYINQEVWRSLSRNLK